VETVGQKYTFTHKLTTNHNFQTPPFSSNARIGGFQRQQLKMYQMKVS